MKAVRFLSILGLMLFFCLPARAEQQRGLALVEGGQKVQRESLKLQQEQTRLLQEIASALRK